MATLAFSFLALLPVMMLPAFRHLHRPTLARSWAGLLAVGACFAVNIGLNNASLLTISLSLNQVIRWGRGGGRRPRVAAGARRRWGPGALSAAAAPGRQWSHMGCVQLHAAACQVGCTRL
jgi:hypothetical protein